MKRIGYLNFLRINYYIKNVALHTVYCMLNTVSGIYPQII